MGRIALFCLGLLALLPFVGAHRSRFNCSVRSNITLVLDVTAAQVQYGAASETAAGLRQPWPEVERKNRKVRVVTYCYSDRPARDRLDCPYVRDAFNRWRAKLDSPAFKGTTNLVWEELNDGSPERSKRQPRYCFNADRKWDTDNVPGDTLWIGIGNNIGQTGSATVGYDSSRPKDSNGYHRMKLGPDIQVDTITHELGHVFGMTHEHQRHDRDDYVFFECKNLLNYDHVIALSRSENKLNYEDARKRLCEDEAFATRYSFASLQYIKDPLGKVHDESTSPFDVQSVMMYPLLGNANPACSQDMGACPLLKYGTIGEIPNRKLPMARIPTNSQPSDGDAKFVQKWYPSVP